MILCAELDDTNRWQQQVCAWARKGGCAEPAGGQLLLLVSFLLESLGSAADTVKLRRQPSVIPVTVAHVPPSTATDPIAHFWHEAAKLDSKYSHILRALGVSRSLQQHYSRHGERIGFGGVGSAPPWDGKEVRCLFCQPRAAADTSTAGQSSGVRGKSVKLSSSCHPDKVYRHVGTARHERCFAAATWLHGPDSADPALHPLWDFLTGEASSISDDTSFQAALREASGDQEADAILELLTEMKGLLAGCQTELQTSLPLDPCTDAAKLGRCAGISLAERPEQQLYIEGLQGQLTVEMLMKIGPRHLAQRGLSQSAVLVERALDEAGAHDCFSSWMAVQALRLALRGVGGGASLPPGYYGAVTCLRSTLCNGWAAGSTGICEACAVVSTNESLARRRQRLRKEAAEGGGGDCTCCERR